MMSERNPNMDSFDNFPTPQWAIWAFVESQLLGADYLAVSTCMESACGQGYMSENMKEYFGAVLSFDILDYGYYGSYWAISFIIFFCVCCTFSHFPIWPHNPWLKFLHNRGKLSFQHYRLWSSNSCVMFFYQVILSAFYHPQIRVLVSLTTPKNINLRWWAISSQLKAHRIATAG